MSPRAGRVAGRQACGKRELPLHGAAFLQLLVVLVLRPSGEMATAPIPPAAANSLAEELCSRVTLHYKNGSETQTMQHPPQHAPHSAAPTA